MTENTNLERNRSQSLRAETALNVDLRRTLTNPEKLTLAEIAALEFHPLADLFPLLNENELFDLARDIEANGLHEPIVLLEHDGKWKILDGRNRYLASRQLGLGTAEKPDWSPFVAFDFHHWSAGRDSQEGCLDRLLV